LLSDVSEVPDKILKTYSTTCMLIVTGRWFSPGTPGSSTNNIDRHDITGILLKVALNAIALIPTRGQCIIQIYLFAFEPFQSSLAGIRFWKCWSALLRHA
jgi:hypothetical protein